MLENKGRKKWCEFKKNFIPQAIFRAIPFDNNLKRCKQWMKLFILILVQHSYVPGVLGTVYAGHTQSKSCICSQTSTKKFTDSIP